MKFIFAISLLVVSFSCFSQTTARKYFDLINSAELDIVRGLKLNALMKYEKAFSQESIPFGNDLINAALCAQELSRFDLTEKYIEELAKKGLSIDVLVDSKLFLIFERTEMFKIVLERYKEWFMDYVDSCNWDLREIYKSMEILDQIVVRHNGQGFFKFDDRKLYDSLNTKSLLDLVENGLFPSEQQIGIICREGDDWRNPVRVNTIVRHSYQQGNFDFSLSIDSLLEIAQITPSFAISNLDIETKGEYCNESVWKINDKYYVEKMSDEKRVLCRENRKKLGAESVDESIEKIIYHLRNPDSKYKFHFFGGVAVLGNFPFETLKMLLKNFEILEF